MRIKVVLINKKRETGACHKLGPRQGAEHEVSAATLFGKHKILSDAVLKCPENKFTFLSCRH